MARWVAVAVVFFAIAGVALVGPSSAAATAEPALFQPEGFDETTFDVTVYDNSSARWTFEHRRTLANDTEAQRFEDFAAEFEGNETDLYRSFVNRSTALVAVGTEATGRNMSARQHSRSSSIEELGQRQGAVTLSFTWTNFAENSEEGVVIGDVFEGGIPIGENQRLVVRHGPNLTFDSAQPDDYTISGQHLAESDSVTWFGERRFADNRPRVGMVQVEGETAARQGSNTVMFLGLLLVVAMIGAGVAYQRGLFDGLISDDSEDDAVVPPAEEGGAASTPAEPEIVSDRDRVKDLLMDNGGRMKQVRIVEETDWSKSKVSMLLSEMEDEGDISKLRVGRENIVSLAGHEPDAAGSPFDDED